MRKRSISIFMFLVLFSVYAQESFQLPPILRTNDGTLIRSVDEWVIHKHWIRQQFTTEMYGTSPALPPGIRFRVMKEKNNALNGKAGMKLVNLFP